tara:strand:+ start:2644 stop:2835 length:192 start_codon:yes stop_codon:yes gene_type:complete
MSINTKIIDLAKTATNENAFGVALAKLTGDLNEWRRAAVAIGAWKVYRETNGATKEDTLRASL